ncbi:MAG TPA: hypothetical protein VMH30_08920 [Verrucomicrobiae bacterium]|nr:hypothetical protein [Verrucomicrobiae bacterium]
MPGQSRLKSLEAQRLILTAESDLNRVQLLRELGRMKEETQALIKPLRTLAGIASTAAKIGLVLSLWRRFRPKDRGNSDHDRSPRPFVTNLFRGMRTGLVLWRALRSPRR